MNGSINDAVLDSIQQLAKLHAQLKTYFEAHAADYDVPTGLMITSTLSSLRTAIADLDAVAIVNASHSTDAQAARLDALTTQFTQATTNLEAQEDRITKSLTFLTAGLKIVSALGTGDVEGAAGIAFDTLNPPAKDG